MPGDKKSKPNNASFYMTWLGYPAMKVAGVPPTQWLARTIAIQQKHDLYFVPALKKIYGEGWQSFFKGSQISMAREGMKSFYKGGLLVWSQKGSTWAVEGFPLTGVAKTFAIDISAGIIAGTGDALFAAVPERAKQLIISSSNNEHTLRSFVNHLRTSNSPLKELFAGTVATSVKQSAMLSSMYVSRRVLNEQHKNFMITTFGPAIVAAFFGAPFDIWKTLVQMNLGKKEKMHTLFKRVIAKSGYRGLFRGVPAKVLLTMYGYSFTTGFLNFLDFLDKQPTVSSNTTCFSPSPPAAPPMPAAAPPIATAASTDDWMKRLKKALNPKSGFSGSAWDPFSDSVEALTMGFSGMQVSPCRTESNKASVLTHTPRMQVKC